MTGRHERRALEPRVTAVTAGRSFALPTARLFIALWPGPRARKALAACRDGTPWPAGTSPIATEKLHLTLHFLGSVPAAQLAAVAAALQVPLRAFDLHLDVADCWHGRLALLRPRTVPPRLRKLHADLAHVLQQLALPVEPRAFKPHVTLARSPTPAQPVAPAEPLHWRVTGYALVQSMVDGSYKLLKCYC